MSSSGPHLKPTPRAVGLAGLCAAVALLAAAEGGGHLSLLVDALALTAALALLLDGLLAWGVGALSVEARAPSRLHLGESDPLPLTLRAAGRGPSRIQALLEVDPRLAPPAPATLSLATGAARISLPLRPLRRGPADIPALWLRWRGPLGLMSAQRRLPLDLAVRITPNTRAVEAAALRLARAGVYLAGAIPQRHLGDGGEFDALREHAQGLDPRAIDWKASARHRKLLVRSYRAERDHPLVLAFDTGRLMSEPLAGLARLDRAINAGLLLADYALRAGERVGIYGFDSQPRGYLPPQAGARAFAAIQATCAGFDYSTEETNFTLGLWTLSSHLRRRSLIIVLTDFVDALDAERMGRHLAHLARRHTVLFVSLKDPTLEALAHAAPADALALHRAVIAAELTAERAAALARLRLAGIHCLDAAPEALAPRLINRCLSLLAR